MPYDTGYMYLEGASFYETNSFLLARYEISRVPYIVYNEEGTVYTTKNQGFIKKQTVGHLNLFASYKEAGLQAPFGKLDKHIKRRGSTDMIKQGALDKIRSSGYRAEYFLIIL